MKFIISKIITRLPWVLFMTIIGSLAFSWVQLLTGTNDITSFIGGKVVEAGQYPEHLASGIGWTTHMVISFSYALMIAVIVSLPILPREYPKRLLYGVVLGLFIGWVSTLISNPAISVTISLLSGQGMTPEVWYPIYWKLGVPLYNHLWYFVAAFLIVDTLPKFMGKLND